MKDIKIAILTFVVLCLIKWAIQPKRIVDENPRMTKCVALKDNAKRVRVKKPMAMIIASAEKQDFKGSSESFIN